MYCVIMAGGRGTRFWPFSRISRPKQLLNIVGDTSMLQMTVDRLRKISAVRDIFIITGEDLAPAIRKEITGVTPENIIVEPSGKNTAPCIGLAALKLCLTQEDCVMGVFPSDHLVVGHREFEKTINTTSHLARKKHSLVTIGITPTYPATAYGYIQYDPDSDEDHLDAYKVKTFAEKPPLGLAREFLSSGDFLWNSGMFVWEVKTFMEELRQYMPELYHNLDLIKDRLAIDPQASINDIWKYIKAESVDYGLMEKSKNIYVFKARYDWSDIGSWNAVYDMANKDKNRNVVKGDGLILDGKDNMIQSDGRFTAIVGVDNLVVINTADATMVIPKDKVESVKNLVEMLQTEKRNDLL
ncbi:MAG: NTP transferase domain-containing protein [Candidatus Marinimicrobia bacterium]|nr:NTP transferase domain-containing protein [Candidatus Neomarinimicrobiota bacterium]